MRGAGVRVSDGSPIAFVLVLKALNFSTSDFWRLPAGPSPEFNKKLKKMSPVVTFLSKFKRALQAEKLVIHECV